jgi:hypothetical protein
MHDGVDYRFPDSRLGKIRQLKLLPSRQVYRCTIEPSANQIIGALNGWQ